MEAQSILHKADTRGFANHGWLKSFHTFSFSSYYHPDRVHFGALRVLNDDTVAGGMGFGTHPHKNMEIISIPLSGDLEHKDSMGNTTVIRENDIQIMSAGTGITHSEYNKNRDKEVKFLQIWVLPKEIGITPRYDQITLQPQDLDNKLKLIVSPTKEDNSVWINQDAWFSLGQYSKETKVEYTLKNPENGVYVFVLSGQLSLSDTVLQTRDGLGVWGVQNLSFNVQSGSKVLVMEVPMLTLE